MIRIAQILIVLFFLNSQVNAQFIQQGKYVIKGYIKGIDSGNIRMLANNGNSIADSAIIVKGAFIMRGTTSLPERRLFSIIPGNWSFRAFIEPATITLSIDTNGAEHHGRGDNKWALIWEIKEQGSAFSDVYEKYKKETNFKKSFALISALNDEAKSFKGNSASEFKIGNQIDSLTRSILKRQKKWIENYIHKYPASIAGIYLFNEFYESSSDVSLTYLKSTLQKFSAATHASGYYRKLQEIAASLEQIQINSLAPDFALLLQDKTRFTLSENKGYTLIDFWASWCAPCRSAIPELKKIYTKFHSKGLNIVGVSNDRSWNDWNEALDKEQMPWPQAIDEFPNKNEPSRVSVLYGFKSLPFYVLIDKDGKVILSSKDENIMSKKIEEIFQ
ncbi:MAG: AhpC/TSA family protein [Chitinophagaceae bacterium]|nr:AhpC/TSA family protein [Chitinophagaceae bacterium]